MNILVVGNGFDIAHGLPTQYPSFLKYVEAFIKFSSPAREEQQIGEDLKSYFPYFESLKNDKQSLFNEISDLLKNNKWITYFCNVYHSREKEGKTGWIDFENEISVIIKALDSIRLTLETELQEKESAKIKKSDFECLKHLFPEQYVTYYGKIPNYSGTSFIYEEKEKLLNDLYRLIRCLEIYLGDFISYNQCKKLKDIAEINADHLLSFNYTDTYERLYAQRVQVIGSQNNTMKPLIETDYIHGKVNINGNTENCNMVVGIDEYQTNGKEDSDNEFIQFKKYYQRIYKMTGCHYKQWLDTKSRIGKTWNGNLTPGLHIFIYGHSLDVTDKDILRDLILEDGAVTTIFYHNKEALGKQIANLNKVIGQQELISRTGGKTQSIIFKQTSTETVS